MAETSRSIQRFWDNDSELWTQPNLHPILSDKEILDRIKDHSAAVFNGAEQGSALDIGAGSGTDYYMPNLSQTDTFIRLDISPETLSGAGPDTKVIADAEFSLPFSSRSFMRVASYFLMRYLSDHKGFIDEVARVCKPQAKILLLDHEYLDHPMGNSDFNPDSIAGHMRRHFTEINEVVLVPQTIQRLGDFVNVRGPIRAVTGIRM